ncbi:MAG: hypothetical protein RIC56_15600 [Pseudomonadales bacterium]
MNIVLARYLNQRMIQLAPDTRGEAVGVLMRSGEYRYVRWLGFIGRERARTEGKPVRLEISRIGRCRGHSVTWEPVPEGSHVQGCLTPLGAYAVVEATVRIV